MKSEAIYWIALAHLPKWGYGKINSLIVKFFHDNITIEDFFNLPESVWVSKYQLNSMEISDLQKQNPNYLIMLFLQRTCLVKGMKLYQ